MQLVKQSFEILEQEIPVRKFDDSDTSYKNRYLEYMYKHIERCARICYKSEHRITENSYEKFVQRMIDSKHCYTGDSEVLTEDGWIKWKNYSGQRVAVINEDLSFKQFETPSRIIKHSYTGKFYDYPELGIKVTDKHTMFGMFRDSKHNFYNEYNYEKFKCSTYYKDNNGRVKTLGERAFKVPATCVKPTYTDPYYELVGFWIGDGCHTKQIINKLKFHLKKQRKIEYLQKLCDEIGFEFEVNKSNQYSVISPKIGQIFNSLYYNQGKTINENNLTPVQIHSVIQGLIQSDSNEATHNSKTITFYTTSKTVYDWVLKFGPIAGYNITCGKTKFSNNIKHKDLYKLFFLSTKYIINNDSRKKERKVIITNETNDVYCVTVSTGLLLIRGINGQTSVCGNCSTLEHGAIYLKFPNEVDESIASLNSDYLKYEKNPYSKCEWTAGKYCYVSTNYRVIIENGWEDDLQYLCYPTKYHEERYTVLLHSCIHVYKDLTRHRKASFSIESTRYCNYSDEKRFGEMKFILPPWCKSLHEGNIQNYSPFEITPEESEFMNHLYDTEQRYNKLIKSGWQPQQAAEILPQCTAADVVMSAFSSDWAFIFLLRSDIAATGQPHPLVKEIMNPLMREFQNRKYIPEEFFKVIKNESNS